MMDPTDSDEMSDIREIEYPQNLLQKVWAAQFRPYPHGQKTDNPNPTWVFVLYHDIDESGTDDQTTSIVEGVFTTLEKANEAALNFFIEDYASFFDQKEDMSNFFEYNTVKNDGFNTVEWNILYDGGVSLEATDAKGPKIHVYVQSHELE